MKELKICFFIIVLFLYGATYASESNKSHFAPSGLKTLIIMQPTGKMINDLPEMKIISDTTQLYRDVNSIFYNSFIFDILEIYYLAATYHKNKNNLTAIEPTYLALSQKDGGYAKVGFALIKDDEHIEKADIPYIDIVENRINNNYNRLMSITQLYPHEMGHLIYGLLNSNKGLYKSRSVDMHYFSVKTDYSTAFNEGFAEHIENVSRIFEQNNAIKKGIIDDIEKTKVQSEYAIKGFEKDFKYSFRIGYFKTSMPVWYQKYENLKRYDHAINKKAKFLTSPLDLNNIEDQLMIRNAGIRLQKNELRNYVQMLSTEGVISSFFTHLIQSELGNHYLDAAFYQPFLPDSMTSYMPKELFTPVQNQFLKYFYVFYEHMSYENTSGSEFVDFIEGYIHSFPEEEPELRKIFKEVTGLVYRTELPPELWLMVKEYPHRFLVPDPYGAIILPFYTFDLNAAEVEDLLTIKGLKKEEAIKIVEYRKTNGFFNDFNQIKDIDGLSVESTELILHSLFDENYMENITLPELSFTSLIITPLKHLFYRLMIYFLIIMGLIYLFFIRNKNLTIKKSLSITLLYLIQWIVFALGGLIFAILSNTAWQYFIMFYLIFIFMNWLIYRKTKAKRNRAHFATCMMCILVMISLI